MRTVMLDDELAELLEREKPLDQAARETIVMDLFRRGKISTGKACELLGLDRVAFARRAAELDIPYFQMTKQDWETEKATIDEWLKSS
jgi:predicted HTH domain antitoxin